MRFLGIVTSKLIKIISLVIFLSALLLNCNKTPPYGKVTFRKTYGGMSYDYGYSVQQASDGGYIVVGTTYSFGWCDGDVYLIKTDMNGDQVWTKTFGGDDEDAGNSVQQTSDGGYIITGYTGSFGAGFFDVYLIKTDMNGNHVWTKTFGGAGSDFGYSVQQTLDSGYIITGTTDSPSSNADVYLIKTDINGDTIWTKCFGGTNIDHGYSVKQTSDGGYIIAGTTYSSGAGETDVYLIKTDANGNQVWSKTFGGTSVDWGYSVQQTSDGGYIIVGFTESFCAGGSDVYLIKTNPNGDTVWTKTIAGNAAEEGCAVRQTSDGGYIICGYTDAFSANQGDIFLIKTDINGNQVWTKTYGGANTEQGNSVQQTTDDGYIIAGTTFSFGNGGSDVYLIKTDEDGNTE